MNVYKTGDIPLYFESVDLDAEMTKVCNLGGKVILFGHDAGDFSSLGVFLDPMGTRMAFWQAMNPS